MGERAAQGARKRRELERGRRLSESSLYELQRRYYRERGVDAWVTDGIPSLVSTSAFLARVYAEAIVAYLLDQADELDRSRPVYVVELGAGSGRLAFLVSRAFERVRRDAPELEGLEIVYVLTDIAPATLEFWRSHPPLAELAERGAADFALWDEDGPARLELAVSGRVLAPGALANPAVAVANYVFDTLEHDAFHVRGGELFESTVTLTGPAATEPDVETLEIEFEDRAAALPYYGDGRGPRVLDEVLAEAMRELEEASVLVPVGAVRALERLDALAGGRLLALVADKGEAALASFAGDWDWAHAVHGGCFSMMVNFHALRRWAEASGGFALLDEETRDTFRFAALVRGDGAFPSLRRILARPLEGFGPADVLGLLEPGQRPSFDLLLALLKASEHDPYVFERLEPAFDLAVSVLEEEDARALAQALRHVARNDYRLGDHLDLPFLLGRLFYALDEPREARRHLLASLRRSGPHHATYYNLGLCCEELDQPGRAVAMYRRALELRPRYRLARRRLAQLEA